MFVEVSGSTVVCLGLLLTLLFFLLQEFKNTDAGILIANVSSLENSQKKKNVVYEKLHFFNVKF